MNFELTEREIAIASGNNPDAIQTIVPDKAGQDTADESVLNEPASGDDIIMDDPTLPDDGGDVVEDREYFDDKDPSSDDPSKEEPSSDGKWFEDPVLIQEAESYGISKAELEAMNDADEYSRVAIAIDRQFAQPSQPVRSADQIIRQASDQQPSQQNQQSVNAEENTGEGLESDLQEIDKVLSNPDEYNEETLALARSTKALVERDQQRELQSAEAQRNAELQRFHEAVDQLGHDFLGKQYGEDGRIAQLTPEQSKNRERLFNTSATMFTNFSSQGAEVPAWPVLARRASRIEFQEELSKRESIQNANNLKNQSRKRRPVSSPQTATRKQVPVSAPDNDHDLAAQIANHPDVLKEWNKAQELNGTG